MEYVEGGTIDSWLRKLGKFSSADALHITITVAEALQHAHELNLVHRDIKPENLLLTKKGVIKLADLGLAKRRDDDLSLTKTGTGAGTPMFMAPEQARDVKHVDGRVDIYALGCMLYVFLTGKQPFTATTLVELIEAKEKGKFTPVRQHNDEVPDRLGLIVEKMMATKPEHRYQSCAEVIVELEALGLAGAHLSFVAQEGPGTKRPGTVPPKKIAVSRVAHAPLPPSVPSTEPPAQQESFWYANLQTPDGKTVTRKLTKDQLLGMIKNQAVDVDTEVSRTRGGPTRALGTYPEFVQLAHAKATKERAERKAEKFKAIYDKIDKEEKSRLRWRWVHNLFLKTGGLIGFLLWLTILAGVIVGGYFLVRWGIEFMGKKFG
jgi:serine/threonine-protein kinase